MLIIYLLYKNDIKRGDKNKVFSIVISYLDSLYN